MSWKIVISHPQTLASKLAQCIFVLLIGSCAACFLAAYWNFQERLSEVLDGQLVRGLSACRNAYAGGGLDAAKTELMRNVTWEGPEKTFFRILDESGRELAASGMETWEHKRETSVPNLNDSQVPKFQYAMLPPSGSQVRIMYARLGPGAILQRGELLDNLGAMKGISTKLVVSLALIVALGVISSLLLGWKGMSGVRAVTETAAAIAGGDLTQRVNIRGRSREVDELTDMFDHMLDQIEALLRSLKEITDDIAHDLRSPITLIRGLAERFALADVSPEEHREISGAIVEGCDKLLDLINTMLDISELNAGAANLDKDTFDLTGMARDTCDLFQPLAEDLGISLGLAPCAPILFWGDKEKLHRALANLVDNAVKYTRPGGTVALSLTHQDKMVKLTVDDDGPGIAEEDLSRVFERFYRPDHSRSKPGHGLGLSLAMAIAKAHGGTIRVQSIAGVKTSFTICLPETRDKG
jgi:signal transduction histidine kinase